MPPRKGPRHALRLIRDLFVHRRANPRPTCAAGFDFLNKVLHRRALVFAFSDFSTSAMKRRCSGPPGAMTWWPSRSTIRAKMDFPTVGLLEIQDAETGQCELVDTPA